MNMYVLGDAFRPQGLSGCFMAECFLPDVDILKPLSCKLETKVLEQPDFVDLYKPEWSNALCEDRKHLDVLDLISNQQVMRLRVDFGLHGRS